MCVLAMLLIKATYLLTYLQHNYNYFQNQFCSLSGAIDTNSIYHKCRITTLTFDLDSNLSIFRWRYF